MRKVTALAWLTLLAPLRGALAASFDCKLATTDFEKIVCRTPSLSALDSQMGDAYAAVLKNLSPEGGRIVTAGQRQWLKMARQSCPLDDEGPTKEDRQFQTGCFEELYRNRLEAIKASAIHLGPFLFSRVDKIRTAVIAHPMGLADDAGPATQQESYPRIDKPQTEQTAALNRMFMPKDTGTECGVHDDGSGDGTGIVGYKLTFANAKVISITWSVWWHCSGTAHGQGGTTVQDIVIASQPRPLTPADLFRERSGWKALLSKLGLKAVQVALQDQNTLSGQADLSDFATRTIKDTVTDPKKWSLHENGLEVQFDSYSLNMGYAAVPDILIPWSDLKPVLSTPLLVK